VSPRIPRRIQPEFKRFSQRPRGDEGTYLAIPEAGRTYFPGTTIPAIGARYVQRNDGLIVPESVARAPQPIDLIQSYITYSELFGFPPDPDYVVEALAAVPRDEFVRGCAALLGMYEKIGASRRDIDRQLTDLWFKGPAVGKIRGLLHDNSTLVAPQTLLLLMQLALVRSPVVPDPEARPRPLPGLIMATQEVLGSSVDEEEKVFTGDPHSALFRQVVASHDFGDAEDVATTIAHHHQRWVRLAGDHDSEAGAMDLYAAFREATGVDKDDFTAVALAIWAHCETHASYPIPAVAVDSFNISRNVVDRALGLIARTADEFRTLILNIPPEFRTEWSFDILRQYPLLRLDNGDILVLSKGLLIERAYGWLPIFDLTTGLKVARRKKDADRAENWLRHLCEVDALAGLANLAGRSRFYGEDAIQRAFGTVVQNADAAIEYADAWVVLEIGTHQLTRATLVAGSPDALESDLKFGIDQKAVQLDATIGELISDESRLTGQPPLGRRRYVPVLVLTEGFPVNPMTTTAIRERLRAAGLFAEPRIGPLHIVDQEELDMAEAIAEDGGPSLLQLLEDHERSSLADSGFKNWLILDRGRGTGPRRPRRLEAVRNEAWQPALDRLRNQGGGHG
jgi:hypothetical protein